MLDPGGPDLNTRVAGGARAGPDGDVIVCVKIYCVCIGNKTCEPGTTSNPSRKRTQWQQPCHMFGFGKSFISWIELMYSRATVLLKVGGGGFSRPVSVQRGIRQGCPLSGMLYALAIEPLLHKLRQSFSGLNLADSTKKYS